MKAGQTYRRTYRKVGQWSVCQISTKDSNNLGAQNFYYVQNRWRGQLVLVCGLCKETVSGCSHSKKEEPVTDHAAGKPEKGFDSSLSLIQRRLCQFPWVWGKRVPDMVVRMSIIYIDSGLDGLLAHSLAASSPHRSWLRMLSTLFSLFYWIVVVPFENCVFHLPTYWLDYLGFSI